MHGHTDVRRLHGMKSSDRGRGTGRINLAFPVTFKNRFTTSGFVDERGMGTEIL